MSESLLIFNMKNFRKLFRKLLDESPASVYAISKESGVTRATIYGWLSGGVRPSQEKLAAVLDALDAEPEVCQQILAIVDRDKRRNPRN